ncbi:formylglycine-generating enzyme family protein [candidate division KSB1 bacterium]|nr:formylglycine-generating enzyme family protein [candidate division KSB1 bacterium]
MNRKIWIFLLTLGMGVVFSCRTEKAQQTGIEWVKIPSGSFEMGDTFGDGDHDEQPVYKERVSGLKMSKTEVTVAQFRRFVEATGYETDAEKEGAGWAWNGSRFEWMEDVSWRNPGFPQGDDHPVVNVSWRDARAFCEWAGCRLPEESEWEYAARDGGKKIKYAWGNDSPQGSKGGNVGDESGREVLHLLAYFEGYDDGYVFTAPVASFAANQLGLHDMTGNVWEWCMTQYEEYIGPRPPQRQFSPMPMETSRVLRGGSYADDPAFSRCSDRSGQDVAFSYPYIGFRVAQ